MKLSTLLEKAWTSQDPALRLLLPFSILFCCVSTLRRKAYEWGVFKRRSFQTPVIVVGNILVGGTGKTPFVIALATYCQQKGLKVGIVSRGYRAQCRHFPHEVSDQEPATFVGDEPALLKRKTGAWVVIDPNRPRAIEHLIKTHRPDIIIADDGLQHYALKPGLTIAIHPSNLDYAQHCLPAGPLREPLSRLKAFDCVVSNLELEVDTLDLDPSWTYTLVTGIARPERVRQYLASQGIDVQHCAFPDHHVFTQEDFQSMTGPIIMTEKDEIKCENLIFSQPVHVIRVKTLLTPSVKKAINSYLGVSS